MNAIGSFGKFIMEYQHQIGLLLIGLLIAAVGILMIQAAVRSRKKHALISQINDTVTKINTAVSSLNDKKSEVIYIDNRASERSAEQMDRAEAIRRDTLQAVGQVISNLNVRPAQEPSGTAETAESAEAAQPAETAQNTESVQPAGTGPDRYAGAVLYNAQDPAAQPSVKEKEPPRKFFSRDAGISKNGIEYTVEELERQIKE